MLKIGKHGHAEKLEQMRGYGYEAIDYQGFVNTTTPLFACNSHDFEATLKEQRKAIEQAGLMVHQTHGPWRYPPQDATEADRKERFEKMARAIEGTAILGSRHFIIHPIMPFGTNDQGHEKETYELNLEFMSRLCRVGQENNVIVCFENMPFPQLSLASVESILAFVKTINNDHFKMCLDTGHCTMFGTSPADAVRMIGSEYLYALHIHDNNGEHDLHWHPFRGVIDWDDFGRALHEIGYQGVISLETSVSDKIPDVLRDYEEIGLFKKAQYIAALAGGEQPG